MINENFFPNKYNWSSKLVKQYLKCPVDTSSGVTRQRVAGESGGPLTGYESGDRGRNERGDPTQTGPVGGVTRTPPVPVRCVFVSSLESQSRPTISLLARNGSIKTVSLDGQVKASSDRVSSEFRSPTTTPAQGRTELHRQIHLLPVNTHERSVALSGLDLRHRCRL